MTSSGQTKSDQSEEAEISLLLKNLKKKGSGNLKGNEKTHLDVARQTLQWLGWWLAFLWFSSVWKYQFSCRKSWPDKSTSSVSISHPQDPSGTVFMPTLDSDPNSWSASLVGGVGGASTLVHLINIAFSKLGRWLLFLGDVFLYVYMYNFWRVSDV